MFLFIILCFINLDVFYWFDPGAELKIDIRIFKEWYNESSEPDPNSIKK